MIPTTGAWLTRRAYFAARLLQKLRRDGARGLAQLRVLIVVVGDPVQDLDRVALRRAVAQAHDREASDGHIRVARSEIVEERAKRVDVAGMRSGEALERDERGAACRRALVLESATEQLELLAEAKLRDGPVRLSANAVVGVAGTRLDLLVPLGAKLRERALVTSLRECVRLGSRLGDRHAD